MTPSARAVISLVAISLSLLPTASRGKGICSNNASLSGGDPHMSTEERAAAVKLLVDTRKEFLDSIQDLTDEQWNYRPAPFKWTIGQVGEHIILAETVLFQQLMRAVDSPANPDWETQTAGKMEIIEKLMPSSRNGKAKAPWEIQPMGKLSKAEVIRRYNEVRGRTLEFAQTTQVALKEHTSVHPFPKFGTLSAYDWLIYIPLHNERHDEQIAAVKASSGYPKN